MVPSMAQCTPMRTLGPLNSKWPSLYTCRLWCFQSFGGREHQHTARQLGSWSTRAGHCRCSRSYCVSVQKLTAARTLANAMTKLSPCVCTS